MNKSIRNLVCAAAVAAAAAPALAAPVINNTGLVSPGTTITFEEVPLSSGASVTNQFLANGVANFGGSLNYGSGFPNGAPISQLGTSFLANFTFFSVRSSVISIEFAQTVSAAAFEALTNDDNSTFTAYLNNVAVESFVTQTTFAGGNYFGFEGIQFDKIEITPGANSVFAMDNLQFTKVAALVPEPSSVALAALGLGALAVARRKRQAPR